MSKSVPAAMHPATLRCALFLFVAVNCFYLLTSTGRVRTPDEYMPLFQSESLVLSGSTAVPQAVRAGNLYGSWDQHRQPRAAYPPGQAFAVAPWYMLGHYVIAHLPGVPPQTEDLVVGFAVALSSATFAAGVIALSFVLIARLGVALQPALLAALMMAFATPLFGYSGWFFSEPLSTVLLVGAALLLFGRDADEPIPPLSALLAGLLLGAAVLVRMTQVLAVPVFIAGILVRERQTREGRRGLNAAFALGCAAAVGVLILLLYNYSIFGNPLEFGYPKNAEHGKLLNTFHTPEWLGLFGFLFSPGKSVFLFAPPVLLALYGWGHLWRRDRGLATVAALAPLVYLLFFAHYTQWEGGYCYGPRYLVPPLTLLCLGLGFVLADASPNLRRVAVLLFVAGFLVQAVGLSTSFLEDTALPGHYYDEHYDFRLAYAPTLVQAKLLVHYLSSPAPAPLGLGLDRWFVFLAKGGVKRATLWMMGLIPALGLIVACWRLRISLRPLSKAV